MRNNSKAITASSENKKATFITTTNFTIILILILNLVPTKEVLAQDLNIDSIRIEADKIENLWERKNFFQEYITKYRSLDSVSTFFIAESLIEIAHMEDSLVTAIVVGNEFKATYYQRQRKFEKSSEIREETIRFMKDNVAKNGKDHSKYQRKTKMIAGISLNLGMLYYQQFKFPKAFLKFEDALKYSKELELDTYVQKVYSQLGGMYHNLGDYELATEYLLKSVNIEGLENSVFSIESYKELGSIFMSKRKDEKKARFYFNKACSLADSLEHPSIELYKNVAYAGLNNYYYELDDLAGADSSLQILEEIAKKIKSDYRLFFAYLRLADLGNDTVKQDNYLAKAKAIDYEKSNNMLSSLFNTQAKMYKKRKNFREARKYAEKALELNTSIENMRYISTGNKMLSDICYDLKDYKSSKDFLKAHMIIKDSLMNEKIANNQDVLSIKYETAKKESEINKLKNVELENNAKITRQRNLLTGSIGGITLVGLLAGSWFQNYKKEKRNNLLLVDKNQIIKTKSDQNELLLKEIHHRVKNNLQTISSLLYLQSSSIQDEDAKDAIAVGQQRVESMALIHKNLYQRENLAAIEMKEYITKLTKNLSSSYEAMDQDIDVNINMQALELDVDRAIPLGLIINELITNCYKYAFVGQENGFINISIIEKANGKNVLKVQDNGPGKQGTSTGFGTSLVNLLSKQIEGEITENNENGYTFELVF